MNILYVCRSVSEDAEWTAVQVQWINQLAQSPGVRQVHVLTTRVGRARLPENVTVRKLSHRTTAHLVISFLREVIRAGPFRQSFFFVVQGGPYPALLLPFKLATGRPIFHWKAQTVVSRRMWFYARFCDDLVFTATEQSLELDLPNKRIVGHGIDTTRFLQKNVKATRDLVTVGRLSPIKGIDRMIEAIAKVREVSGVAPTLDVVGSFQTEKSARYVEQLRAHAAAYNVEEHVHFRGHVPFAELPDLLPQYRASLNFSGTAFDKAVGEAMACGVPVITTNPAVIESLPADLRGILATDRSDIEAIADSIDRVLNLNEDERKAMNSRVRRYIEEEHSLASFFGRILAEIRAHPSRSRA